MNLKTTIKKIDDGRVDELSSLAFDWICRYKLDKEESVFTHEIVGFLSQFEKDGLIRYSATIIALQTLMSIGWVDVKD